MAATTMATTTMAALNTKCLTLNTNKTITTKPNSLLPFPKGLTSSNPPTTPTPTPTPTPLITAPAIAGAIFATLGSVDSAIASQHLNDIAAAADTDNRGLALLLPIVPAIGWVLFNILQPALNQFNRMRSEKSVIVGLGVGLSGLLLSGPEAQAASQEIAEVAERVAANGGGSDNRGQLLLLVVLPAIGWVLFNILQPALNQLNKMRSQ